MLSPKGVNIVCDDKSREWISDNGFNPAMGARPLKRLFEDKVKKPLSRQILFGELKHGGTVKVTCKKDNLEFIYEGRKPEEDNSYQPREAW